MNVVPSMLRKENRLDSKLKEKTSNCGRYSSNSTNTSPNLKNKKILSLLNQIPQPQPPKNLRYKTIFFARLNNFFHPSVILLAISKFEHFLSSSGLRSFACNMHFERRGEGEGARARRRARRETGMESEKGDRETERERARDGEREERQGECLKNPQRKLYTRICRKKKFESNPPKLPVQNAESKGLQSPNPSFVLAFVSITFPIPLSRADFLRKTKFV